MKNRDKKLFIIISQLFILITLLGVISYILEYIQVDFLVGLTEINSQLNLFFINAIYLLLLQYGVIPIIGLIISKVKQSLVLYIRNRQYKKYLKSLYDLEYINFYNNMKQNKIEYIFSIIDSPAKLVFSFFTIIQYSIILIAYLFIIFTINMMIFVCAIILFVLLSIAKYLYVKREINNQIASVPEDRKAEYYKSILFDKKTIKEVKSFNTSNYFSRLSEENFRISSNKRFKLRIKNAQQYDLIKSISIFTQLVLIALILIFNNQSFDIYSSMLLASVFFKSLGNINNLIDIIPDFTKNFFHYNQSKSFFEQEKNKVQEKIQIKVLESIELKKVSFQYPNSKKKALSDINIQIYPNQSISIIGENGAGKSTLIKIIIGLIKPNSGEVLINGISVESIDLLSYHRLLSIEFQDIVKLDVSFFENIVLGNIDNLEPKDRYKYLIEKFNMHNIIDKLPNRENTILGKMISDGVEISVGEWQRVTLSRALMSDSFYILDEPTASIDPIQEGKLFDVLEDITTQQKGILISHRIGFSKLNDLIYVMSNGKILEKGNHDELMRSHMKYYEMYSKQNNSYTTEE